MNEEYSDVTWDTAGGSSSQRNPLASPSPPSIASPPITTPLTAHARPSSSSSTNSNSNPNVNRQSSLTTFAMASHSAIRVTVTDPQKHGEGGGSYVTYLVTTKTVLDSFSAPEQSVRRRFTDFVWLNRQLLEEFPACILPPVPGKRRMESYVTGDRFSPIFLERRRAALQIFLQRIARHPTLQRSAVLKRFLEASALDASILPDPADRPRQSSSSSSGGGTFDNISDTLMNAFAKVKKPDERFVEIREVVDKFEENLKSVEKLTGNLEKYQTELEQELTEFSGCITTLGVMETQITSPIAEFANTVSNICTVLKDKIEHEEVDYLNALHEYINYCQCVKDVLRLRDQKQVDYEELVSYHTGYSAERERLLAGRTGSGISGFFKENYRDLRGVDQEKARHAEIARLENKIAELEEAVQKSQQISIAFSSEVVREVDFFQSAKVFDFKEFLRDYTDTQLEFYQRGFKYWDQLIPILDDMKAEDLGPDPADEGNEEERNVQPVND